VSSEPQDTVSKENKMTTEQAPTAQPKRINIHRHRLGMGWHYLWEYDPPIDHQVRGEDGTPYYWREFGETSEGAIMWLADRFAREHLGTTARELYRQAYQAADDQEFDDEWLDTDCLRGMWAKHTVVPKRWTATQIRKLFEDLEDVNYHGFLSKLIDLTEPRLPHLAVALADWYKPAPKPAHAPTSAH